MNEHLRRALFRAHMSEVDIATRLEVDPKTVRRWLEGRLPYPRHRWELAQLLDLEEPDLWPQLRSARPPGSRNNDIAGVYPHRSSVPPTVWRSLLASACEEIGILAYSGLFLAEDPEIIKLLTAKAANRVSIRIALGKPTARAVVERGHHEQIGDAMAAKVRNALVLYRPLMVFPSVEVRLHSTVLYNSIYRFDHQLLVNQHVFGMPAARAPVYHLRELSGAEMFTCYLSSFDRVWSEAAPLT